MAGAAQRLVTLRRDEPVAGPAERIRFHLGNMPVIYGAESIQVTASLGVSAMVPLPNDPGEDSAARATGVVSGATPQPPSIVPPASTPANNSLCMFFVLKLGTNL